MFKYQIKIDDWFYTEIDNVEDFCEIYFRDLGTCAGLYVVNVETGSEVDGEELEEATGVSEELWSNLFVHRMSINNSYRIMREQMKVKSKSKEKIVIKCKYCSRDTDNGGGDVCHQCSVDRY